MASPPIPIERVLPTLNADGTRRRIRPKLYQGRIHSRRRIVAWGLLILFISLPFIRVGGLPAIFLNVAERQFTFFGRTFLATDGVLLMLLLLSIFVTVILVTALFGRAFCGWACPQTVYMEFIFRPVERFFEGDRNSQLRLDQKGGGLRRVAKYLTFAVLSVFVANVFLAYFVSVDTLKWWVMQSPFEHPGGFLVMGVTAALVFYDFGFFREQMCTVACPYARLQAALFDKDSLIIGYDAQRGEPRKKGKPVPGGGDCIDCSACVVACPTGIDIREGLQLECIACGQCVDACNTIMPKIGKPLDLVRFTSQSRLAGLNPRAWRPRTIVYSVLLLGLVSSLLLIGGNKQDMDVTVLRGIGAPFIADAQGVRNQLRVKVENRTKQAGAFSLSVELDESALPSGVKLPSIQVIIPENPLRVEGLHSQTTSLFVLAKAESFQAGRLPVIVLVRPENSSDPKETQRIPYVLLGPSANSAEPSASSPDALPPVVTP